MDGQSLSLVDLEGHGRKIFDDVDVSRTVGWFTTLFPVLLNLGEASHPGDALKVVKNSCVASQIEVLAMVCCAISDDKIEETLETLLQAEVIFNYLGQFDQTFSELSLFGLAQESSGPTRSLQGKRCHLLEINGLVSGDSCDWTGRTARTFIEPRLSP